MPTQQLFNLINQEYESLTATWGLSREFAIYVAVVRGLMRYEGYPPPIITSGYRSPEYQRDLQQRWDSGNRKGLVARPANRSWHMQGRAIDVSTGGPNFNLFTSIMTSLPDVRWGGNFRRSDPVHFDLPGERLLSIDQLLST